MNILKKTFVLPLLLLLMLAFPVATLAQSEKVMALSQDSVVDSDYFAAGEMVVVSGTVNGDAYLAGGTVLVDGVINGDLLVAGGDIVVSGSINGNVRAVGGNITIIGDVLGNVSAAGGNFSAMDTAAIDGSMALAAGNIVVNTQVTGDMNIAAGMLQIGSNANVGGNVKYFGDEELLLSDTAVVGGELTTHTVPSINKPDMNNFMNGINLYAKIASIFTSAIVGLLFVKLFPAYTKRAASTFNSRFLLSLAIGFVSIIVIPFVAVLLVFTLLGIPLSLLVLAVFAIYLYIARVYVMLAFGTKIAEWLKIKTNNYWIFLLGLSAYYLVSLIPFIGGLVKFVVIVVGLGAAMINEKNTWALARKSSVV